METEDEKKEKHIEETIRMMRKQAGKAAQRRPRNENPAPKRRKLTEGNEYKEARKQR